MRCIAPLGRRGRPGTSLRPGIRGGTPRSGRPRARPRRGRSAITLDHVRPRTAADRGRRDDCPMPSVLSPCHRWRGRRSGACPPGRRPTRAFRNNIARNLEARPGLLVEGSPGSSVRAVRLIPRGCLCDQAPPRHPLQVPHGVVQLTDGNSCRWIGQQAERFSHGGSSRLCPRCLLQAIVRRLHWRGIFSQSLMGSEPLIRNDAFLDRLAIVAIRLQEQPIPP